MHAGSSGARVLATDLDLSVEALAPNDGAVAAAVADVSRVEDVDRIFAGAEGVSGGVDCLVSTHPMGCWAEPEEVTDAILFLAGTGQQPRRRAYARGRRPSPGAPIGASMNPIHFQWREIRLNRLLRLDSVCGGDAMNIVRNGNTRPPEREDAGCCDAIFCGTPVPVPEASLSRAR